MALSHRSPSADSLPVRTLGSGAIPLTTAERDEILAIFVRLKEDDFLRKFAPPPYGDGAPANTDTLRIIERLWISETLWRERAFATWTLGRMHLAPSDKHTAANALVRLITNRMKTAGSGLRSRFWRAWLRTAKLTIAGYVALLLLFFLLDFMMNPQTLGTFAMRILILFPAAVIGGLFLSTFALPFALPLCLILDSARTNFVRATAVTALGRLGVPEQVGALADALVDNNRRVREAAEPALQAVLPLLTTAHYGQLSAGTVPGLCRALNHVFNITPFSGSPEAKRREDLLLLLIEALGKVGDGSTVMLMEFLAKQTELPRVQNAAASVLPILLERKKQENARDMLLRASSLPVTPSAELLRPLATSAETKPQQLLRPSASHYESTTPQE